jgi:hypothetical protein
LQIKAAVDGQRVHEHGHVVDRLTNDPKEQQPSIESRFSGIEPALLGIGRVVQDVVGALAVKERIER